MPNLGITATARRLARQGKSEAEIRAALAGHGAASIETALFYMRSEALLPPRQKLRPNNIAMRLPSDCSAVLTKLATGRGVSVGAMAKSLMIERLRGGA